MSEPADQAIHQALAEFYTPSEIVRWLVLPHPELGGATAVEAIDAGCEDRVWAIIDRLRSGAYV